MRPPVIILGSNPVQLGDDALFEPENAKLEDLEKLIATSPRAAVVTSGGATGFFRASLCLERGVSRVVLRRGAFEEAWERELAARAAAFGAELYVHDDARGYGRVKPGARTNVGAPVADAWTRDPRAIFRDEPQVDAEPSEPILPMDPDIAGLPSNLEETAFAIGDKPVLYLVLPTTELPALREKYAEAKMVLREIPLEVEGATGRRVYASSSGRSNAHVFISKNAEPAEKAARLWDEGSSRHAQAMGELLGYPRCCAAAFAALAERGNNAALVYATAARTRALGAHFHGVLNSAVRHVVPYTPCSFGCPRAIGLAERVIAALPADVADALRGALSRPVFYLDESRAVVFNQARMLGQTVEYASAALLQASAPLPSEMETAVRLRLGALFSGPGKIVLGSDDVEVHTSGRKLRWSRQTHPLGIWLPFGGV